MQKVVEFFKNVILTTAGIFRLVAIVYLGAVGFMAAVLAEKILKAMGSQLTVDQILHDIDSVFFARYEEYRHSWDNFHFKNLRLPF